MITIHRLLWGLADKLTRTRPQRASRSIKLNVRACLCTTNVCARFPSGRSFDPDPCDKQATARAQKINPLIDSKLPALQIRSPEPPLSLRLNRHCQLAGCRTTLLIDSTSGAGVGGCHSAAPLLLLLQLTQSVAPLLLLQLTQSVAPLLHSTLHLLSDSSLLHSTLGC
jgi:hypothetical protein